MAAAEEEAVDSVGSVLTDGGVVETIFTCGVGGKGGKELKEIGVELRKVLLGGKVAVFEQKLSR